MNKIQKEASDKIISVRGQYKTDKSLAELLGVSRPTIRQKLKEGNWTTTEAEFILYQIWNSGASTPKVKGSYLVKKLTESNNEAQSYDIEYFDGHAWQIPIDCEIFAWKPFKKTSIDLPY